jgi:ribonuclease P protein component
MTNKFPKSSRLLKSTDFKRTLKIGKKLVLREFVILATPKEDDSACSQIGFIVSKKVGESVTRNRVKRLLKEGFRQLNAEYLLCNCHIVIIARHGILQADFKSLQKSLIYSFNRLKPMLTH